MITAAGANLFGQWDSEAKVLKNFQKVKKTTSKLLLQTTQDDTAIHVIHLAWSYTLWRSDKHFYLTGSWLGENNQKLKIKVPEELIGKPTSELYLTGSDRKLVMFSKLSNDFWVLNFIIPFAWNWSHKRLPACNLNETNVKKHQKKMKFDRYVTKAVCSYSSVYLLMSDGCVFELPNEVDTENCIGKVVDIACGFEHTILLTDAGQVYTWGNGRRCQLGHGNLLNKDGPTLVEGLAGIKITKIKAGGWHTLALSEFGDLYAWGWNDTGQLGVKIYDSETPSDGSLRSLPLPTIVEFFYENKDPVQINVKDMACGSRHSAVILCDNTLWTTGINSYGQLGFCPDIITSLKYFKKSFACFGNSSLLCGPWSTAILLGDT